MFVDSLSPGPTFGLAIALVTSLVVGRMMYNVYMHPLRKYPGPWWAAATDLPLMVARARGRAPFWVASVHEQYGEVVRIGVTELSYITPDAWRDIHGHKSQNAGRGSLPKNLSQYNPDIAGHNGIIRTNDPDHARQRRLLAHAFSDKALREQEPLICQYVELLVRKLGAIAKGDRLDVSSRGDGTTDLLRFLNFTTFDVIGDLTFGEPLGLLQQNEYSPWVAAIFNTVKIGNLLAVIATYAPAIAGLLALALPREARDGLRLHKEDVVARVDKRLARSTTRPDIWTFVLRHKNDEKSMPLHEMHATASVLMIAGTETTATLLSGLTYTLLRPDNADKLQRLKDEVRGAFAAPGEMTMAALAQLPYLQACLEEGLRLYPPVPVALPRITPKGGAEICGEHVVGDTTVGITMYAAYRSPRNFHAPTSFHPERWLANEAGPEFANDRRAVLEPFSFGPRNCIGKNLAYHEMRLILANIAWHFDLKLCPESDDWMERQEAYALWQKPALRVGVGISDVARAGGVFA
ncbi:uncharacterized protein K452DRAFT_248194 [Aplosporella prunicola CBS 121167]|uniref:Cytochrome P450 n=1 Tax=Aplosporella prunicola CBS 121167 TaxID=1176127 RepID=A0A6A6BIR5_9PEZI|nr:uncharacterized protein K452DRAFT_248194 [Aplosporella prunicola CBS 121167]KAF2142717.1 hypothetical protein K452DRAFT_248194 [Aplosporella prunicola CBS 121167]